MVKGRVRRRGVRLKNVKRSDGTVNDGDNVDTLKSTVSIKEYQSAIARYLSLNSEFAKVYCDGCFSVVSRTRSRRHLEVLESATGESTRNQLQNRTLGEPTTSRTNN